MTHKTSQFHYEKYKNLSKKYNKYLKGKVFGSYESVLEKYQEDKYLNNIPLERFDKIARHIFPHNAPLSLSEKVCILKHVLFYQVLKLKPNFTD